MQTFALILALGWVVFFLQVLLEYRRTWDKKYLRRSTFFGMLAVLFTAILFNLWT